MFKIKNKEIRRLNEEISRLQELNQELELKLAKAENRADNYRLNYIHQKRMNVAWSQAIQDFAVGELGFNPGREANNAVFYPVCRLVDERFERLSKSPEEKWDLDI